MLGLRRVMALRQSHREEGARALTGLGGVWGPLEKAADWSDPGIYEEDRSRPWGCWGGEWLFKLGK